MKSRDWPAAAAICRKRAMQAGYHWATPILGVLAEYGSLSNKLPWPSQKTLATETGFSERQIRRQIAALEDLGLICVYRSKPQRRQAGVFTRQTNRYQLCDLRARRMRRGKPPKQKVSPRGHERPVTPKGFEPERGAHRRSPIPKAPTIPLWQPQPVEHRRATPAERSRVSSLIAAAKKATRND